MLPNVAIVSAKVCIISKGSVCTFSVMLCGASALITVTTLSFASKPELGVQRLPRFASWCSAMQNVYLPGCACWQKSVWSRMPYSLTIPSLKSEHHINLLILGGARKAYRNIVLF